LDLVPIAAWYGNGRKAGWFSPFLLAAYDPDTETYASVCRCMSGFTDAFYAEVRRLIRLQVSAG
jgi:DNA ligase-1